MTTTKTSDAIDENCTAPSGAVVAQSLINIALNHSLRAQSNALCRWNVVRVALAGGLLIVVRPRHTAQRRNNQKNLSRTHLDLAAQRVPSDCVPKPLYH